MADNPIIDFHYAHYTRTFRKQEILVTEGKVSAELDFTFSYLISDALNSVLDIFDISHRPECYPYSPYMFDPKDKDISECEHVWQRELGMKDYGDFIRVTTTYSKEQQKQFEGEWDGYMDYMSMPSV